MVAKMIRPFLCYKILSINFLLAVCSKPYEPHFVALDHERNKVNFFEYKFVDSKVSATFENLPSKKDHVLRQGLLKGKKFNEDRTCEIKLPMKLLNWKKPVLLCLFKNEWEQDVIKRMQVDIKGEGENSYEDDSFQEVVKPVTGFAKKEDASLVTGYIINSEFYGQVRLLDKHSNHLVVYYIEPVKNALLYDSKTPIDQVEQRKAKEDPDANAILFEYIAHIEQLKTVQRPTGPKKPKEERTTKKGEKTTTTTRKTTTTTPPVIHSTQKSPKRPPPGIRSSSKPRRKTIQNTVQSKVIHSSARPPTPAHSVMKSTIGSQKPIAVIKSTAKASIAITGPHFLRSTTNERITANKVLHSTQSAIKQRQPFLSTTRKMKQSTMFHSTPRAFKKPTTAIMQSTKVNPGSKKKTWFKSTKIPSLFIRTVFHSTTRRPQPTEASLFKSSTVSAKPTLGVFQSTKRVGSPKLPQIFRSTSKKPISTGPDFIRSTQPSREKTHVPFFKSTKNTERIILQTSPFVSTEEPPTTELITTTTGEPTFTEKSFKVSPSKNKPTLPVIAGRHILSTPIMARQLGRESRRKRAVEQMGIPITRSTQNPLRTLVTTWGPGNRRKRLLVEPNSPKSFFTKGKSNRRRKRDADAIVEENIDDNDIIEEIKYPAGGKRGKVQIFDVNRFKKKGAICRLCIWIQPEFATNHGFLHGATYGAAEVVDLIRYINWLFRSMDFNMDYAPENVGFSIRQIVVAESEEVDILTDNDWKQDQEKVVTTVMKEIQPLFWKPCCVFLAFVYRNMQPYGSLTYRRGMCVKDKNIAVISGQMQGHKVAKFDVYRFVVHALGHLMGALNDDNTDPDCNDATPSKFLNPLIMHPIHQINVGPRPNSMRLSYCARLKIATFLASGYSACFEEEEKPFCGNGVVEEGEECDCGAPWQCIFDTHPCCGIRDRFSSCKVIDMIPRGKCSGPTVLDEDLDYVEEY